MVPGILLPAFHMPLRLPAVHWSTFAGFEEIKYFLQAPKKTGNNQPSDKAFYEGQCFSFIQTDLCYNVVQELGEVSLQIHGQEISGVRTDRKNTTCRKLLLPIIIHSSSKQSLSEITAPWIATSTPSVYTHHDRSSKILDTVKLSIPLENYKSKTGHYLLKIKAEKCIKYASDAPNCIVSPWGQNFKTILLIPIGSTGSSVWLPCR